MISLKCKEIACHIYSVLFFLSGLTLIVVSCLMWYQVFYHSTFLPGNTTLPFVILVFIGLIQLFVTWLTVKGPSTEHDFFIVLSVITIIVILLIELSIGIFSLILMKTLNGNTESLMMESFSNHARNYEHHKKEWNTLESKLECCGVKGPQDYGDRPRLPVSCCFNDLVTNKCNSIHQIGCKVPLVANIKPLLRNIGIAAFLTTVLHVCGVAAFITYFKALKLERLQRSENRSRLRQSLRIHHQSPTGPNQHPVQQPVTPHSPSAPVYS